MNVPVNVARLGALLVSAWITVTVGDLLAAVSGPGLPLLWWSARAVGLVAWFALWMTMMLGVMIAGRSSWIEPSMVMALHQQWALCAALSTLAHVLLVIADDASGVSTWAAVVPFASATLTGPVALGTLAAWALGLLVGTSWLRPRVPPAAWRAIHGTAFGGWVLAMVHGVTAGSDVGWWPVQLAWVTASVMLVGAVVHRVAGAVSAEASRAA